MAEINQNVYGYQYQPPTLPANASPAFKRYHNELMELFDRLFSMKLGGDRVKKNAITADNIAAGAVTAEKIEAGAITAREIAAGSIEFADLSEDATGQIQTGIERNLTDSTLKLYAQKTDVDTAVGGVQASLQLGIDGLETRVQTVEGTSANVETWLTFGTDGLTIGKSDSEYKTVTDNNGYHIKKGEADVIKITETETEIPELRVTQNLYLGTEDNIHVRAYRCYGGYGFVRVGAVVANGE